MEKLNRQQKRKLASVLRKLSPKTLTSANIRALISDKEHPFWSAFEEATKLIVTHNQKPQKADLINLADVENQEILSPWVNFYKKYFGMNVDFSGIKIPDKVEGFDKLIVIAKGISLDIVHQIENQKYTIWKWCSGELELSLEASERGLTKASYAIWVRNSREADTNLLGFSANEIEDPVNTENLLERKIHGLKYWDETQSHLDQLTFTLCPCTLDNLDNVIAVDSLHSTELVYIRVLPKRHKDVKTAARRVIRAA